MTDTQNPVSTTGAVTLWVNGRDARDGAATLTRITDATSGHTGHLVTVDRRATECYGIRQPDSIIGGLVRMRGRWAPTAYRDRSHLFNHQGPTYFLPYAQNRACAVRGLLRW
jgi:hypothetical protein